ncbi:hypothetical protein C2G38_2181618 [Gigaspora rosea]|uniref:Uncharacterized protein n=1 Tax=Gigaspora rosea TaxID=44941 RepID=A0A397VAJ8_9GLOM|nr:hypothetical protein C2G38_2181618 [Gigaspora rosea]
MDSRSTQDSSKKCIVKICKGVSATTFRKITNNVLIKAESNETLASYYRDHKDEYMCSNCYNAIVVNGTSAFKEHAVEWERGFKRHRKDNILSMFESISVLTNIIFEQEIIGNDPPMVSFSQLRSITESKNDQLSFFFNEIEAMACLERKSEAEQKELDRSLAYQCYLMCWNQSMAKPLWNLKDEFVESGNNLTWLQREMVAKNFRLSSFFDSIYNAALPEDKSSKYLDKIDKKLAIECYIICDALSHAGIMISRRHLDREKIAIADNHPHKVASYLESKKSNALVLNVDDYHNIHTKRTPDTCSTSSAAHMTTLLLNGSVVHGHCPADFSGTRTVRDGTSGTCPQ